MTHVMSQQNSYCEESALGLAGWGTCHLNCFWIKPLETLTSRQTEMCLTWYQIVFMWV